MKMKFAYSPSGPASLSTLPYVFPSSVIPSSVNVRVLSSSAPGPSVSDHTHGLSIIGMTAAPPYSGPVPPYTTRFVILYVPRIVSWNGMTFTLYSLDLPVGETTVNVAAFSSFSKFNSSPTVRVAFAPYDSCILLRAISLRSGTASMLIVTVITPVCSSTRSIDATPTWFSNLMSITLRSLFQLLPSATSSHGSFTHDNCASNRNNSNMFFMLFMAIRYYVMSYKPLLRSISICGSG